MKDHIIPILMLVLVGIVATLCAAAIIANTSNQPDGEEFLRSITFSSISAESISWISLTLSGQERSFYQPEHA